MIAKHSHRRRVALHLGALLAPFALVGLFACGGSDAPAPKTGSTKPVAKSSQISHEEAAKRARTQYDSVCLTCHGAGGNGDGPGAAALNPKPRTFTDTTWQKGVSDEGITKAILYGGASVGKSANMPAHPLLKDQPLVVAEIVKIVRAFNGRS